ncbi:hypothetical protein FB472_1270 [Rhodoglobus vestalii]|uniref:Uncharacterized protein n=1 Tax=Rhodoglobus vestalii TaxID=193384 RepID=A0A8H2K7Z0_9MICO|nr:hypothetical protein FB472_1270 [Rhodoglobus vestalii]
MAAPGVAVNRASPTTILYFVNNAVATLPPTLPIARPFTTLTALDPAPYFCGKLPESGWDSDAFCLCLSHIPAEAEVPPFDTCRPELTEVDRRLLQ